MSSTSSGADRDDDHHFFLSAQQLNAGRIGGDPSGVASSQSLQGARMCAGNDRTTPSQPGIVENAHPLLLGRVQIEPRELMLAEYTARRLPGAYFYLTSIFPFVMVFPTYPLRRRPKVSRHSSGAAAPGAAGGLHVEMRFSAL